MKCKNCPVLKHFQTKINAAGKYLVLERAGIFMQKEESAAYQRAAYQHLITIFSDDQVRTEGSRGFLVYRNGQQPFSMACRWRRLK